MISTTQSVNLALDDNPESAPRAVAAEANPPGVSIRPSRGWQFVDAAALWRCRELIFFLTWRDVKVRYKHTGLGVAWAVLQPLTMMVILSIAFGRLASVTTDGVPYPLFALAGLLPWTLFATAVANCSQSIIRSERLITHVYFPRLVIPIAAVGSAVIDFWISFVLLLGMMIFYRRIPGSGFLLMPFLFALITFAALGLGTVLAALSIAYRDFRHVISFIIQAGMFATPTIYMQPDRVSGGWLSALLVLNPMNSLIASFRSVLLGLRMPWASLGLATGLITLMTLIGFLYFRKVEDNMADII